MHKLLLTLFGLAILGTGLFFVRNDTPPRATPSPTASPVISPSPSSVPTADATPQPTPTPTYTFPIAEFRERATKKVVGTFVSPSNSPVQPERFRGYHTAVDVEYGDITSDIPVMAIAAGTVVRSTVVDGYGGLVVIEHLFQKEKVYSIYGHLRPSSLIKEGPVKRGDQLGVLGTAYSAETSGERRHLHFGLLKSDSIDLRGYVQDKAELTKWLDPLTFF
ncbi:MAG TPA: M23 family metallopeptidase [Verrucomicrobiae bacterium]|nr:M23 family metallopeptidase [Verrucomicrobiae bacterium]